MENFTLRRVAYLAVKNAIRACNIVGGALNVAAAYVEEPAPLRQPEPAPIDLEPLTRLAVLGAQAAARWFERA